MDERPLVEGYIANFGISLDVFKFLSFGWFFAFFKKLGFWYSWPTLPWYWCYYPHWSRDALSPVCGIFSIDIKTRFFLTDKKIKNIIIQFFSVKCFVLGSVKQDWGITEDGFFLEKFMQNIEKITKTRRSSAMGPWWVRTVKISQHTRWFCRLWVPVPDGWPEYIIWIYPYKSSIFFFFFNIWYLSSIWCLM